MTDALHPTSFSLMELNVVDIGPLRQLSATKFTTPAGDPTNLFLLMGWNGSGKTTVLEAVYLGMRLLGERSHLQYGSEALDDGDGGLQLDALVELDDGTRSEQYLLSIVAGRPGVLRNWRPDELPPGARQIFLIYERRTRDGPVERSAKSDPQALLFADAILERRGSAPVTLFDSAYGYPTVLYFRSDRSVVRPQETARAITPPARLGYYPAHCFGADTGEWSASLDNLFVWFAWLDDGRERLCRDLVNELVFRDGRKMLDEVDRERLAVPVRIDDKWHRLDQLSSGERQLVQLIVRVAAHMTGPTIVLIDETEQHLHLGMRRRLMKILKDWVRLHDQLSFVVTSHSLDTLRMLHPKTEEAGLRKSGALLKPRFALPR